LTCLIIHLQKTIKSLCCRQSPYPPLRLIPPPCIWNNHSASMYQKLNFRCSRNQTRGLPVLHYAIIKISRRCHRITVEIFSSTALH